MGEYKISNQKCGKYCVDKKMKKKRTKKSMDFQGNNKIYR